MMGHVINLLVQFLREVADEETVDRIIERAGLRNEEYRFEHAYPEEEFSALLATAVLELGIQPDDAQVAFAEFFMRVSPEYFPAIFKLAGDARTLLERIPHLHRSIPKAADAENFTEKLIVDSSDADSITFRYESPHRLCTFLRRACRLSLDHYGEDGEIRTMSCKNKGDASCHIRVAFAGKKAA